VNDLLWVTLQVNDLEQARNFWRDVIGLPEKSYAPGWIELELRPGVHLALHSVFHVSPFEKRGYDRGGPVLGIRVASLAEMGALVERSGAQPLSPAQEIPGGRSRDYEDPEGYVFELVELTPAETQPSDAPPAEVSSAAPPEATQPAENPPG
jgi:predicted enzyme related to lactoylglutathione lyase